MLYIYTWESTVRYSYFQTLSCTANRSFVTYFARVASSFSPISVIHACEWIKIGNLKSSNKWLQTKVMSNTNFDPFAIKGIWETQISAEENRKSSTKWLRHICYN